MNCSLKCDRQNFSPYRCLHIELIQIICRNSTTSLSYNREDFLHARYTVWWYMEMMWPNSTFGFRIFSIFWIFRISWMFSVSRCCKFHRANFLPMIQVLLVFICRYKFSCAWIEWSIPLPSLRTRRCVGIGISSCVKFAWTSNLSTRYFEYPRASRRNQTVHSWRTCSRENWSGSSPLAWISPQSCFPSDWSGILFAILSVQLITLKFLVLQVELKWLMLNKWRRLFHSSCAKFLWSICLQSGVWCHCTWFGSWGPG